MNDYKPNSNKYKEEQKAKATEEKRVSKVVKGVAKTKKKNDIRKLADVFITEDADNVKSYILSDVLVPTIKNAIVNIVTDAVHMIFLGGTSRSKGTSDRFRKPYVSYTQYSDPRDDRYSDSSRPRSRFDYDDIVFESRVEAETVHVEMMHVIKEYGFVTVADLYDMADLPAPYTSNRYGWTQLRSAEVLRVRDGYILKLPKAAPID